MLAAGRARLRRWDEPDDVLRRSEALPGQNPDVSRSRIGVRLIAPFGEMQTVATGP
ncbi:MAG: hypothetical protein JWQ73_880 [Variovorax sp.]|nr:hypothetical protein [Variovorax sp.]